MLLNPRLRSTLLLLLGFGLVLATSAADRLVGGAAGMGDRQVALLLFGAVLAGVSALLRLDLVERHAGTLTLMGAVLLAACAGATRFPWHALAVALGLTTAAFNAPGPGGAAFRRAVAEGLPRERALLDLLFVVAQLGLAAFVMRAFHIESQAFYETALAVILAGFLLLQFVPRPRRLFFFALLSLAGLVVVLGVGNAAWVVGVGAALIGAAHLPLPFRWRALVVGALALLLTAWRGQWLAGPVPAAVWPILGSLFMFRLIIYMYDLAHAQEKPHWSRVVAYFFMLPNVVFPFFPVVDYTTFRRTHYDKDPGVIHTRGMHFIFWGVAHLLAYRLVSTHLMLAPERIAGGAQLLQYMLANFFLYLRVSGQFHLIVGLLHLYGFNLPETHRLYYLAAGFTDLWRRINIYWKDFMLKVFYYPINFKLKKLGPMGSMVVATLLVFVLTWAFHAYQWFWLRGTLLWTVPDMLFWGILGLFVVGNSVQEMRQGRRRTLGERRIPWGERIRHAATVYGTFVAMMVLWSLWSATTVREWLGLFSTVRLDATLVGAVLGLTLAGILALTLLLPGRTGLGAAAAAAAAAPAGGKLAALAAARAGAAPAARPAPVDWLTPAGLALLAALAVGPLTERLPRPLAQAVQGARWARLNARDAAQMVRGYYEGLNEANNLNGDLWQVMMRRPEEVPIWKTEAARTTHDYLQWELVPNASIIFRGQPYQTNRWGMRDRDYEQKKPAGAVRVAFVGDSHTEGWGVGNGENYTDLLESALAREPLAPGHPPVELLNFSVGGYTPFQELIVLEKKVPAFEPDQVFVVGNPEMIDRALAHMWLSVRAGVACPYPELADVAARAAAADPRSMPAAVQALMPDADRVLTFVYTRMAEQCRRLGVPPVFILLPGSTGEGATPGLEHALGIVRGAGFTVFNLMDVYAGHDPTLLQVAEWDHHPNAQGHRLIAQRMHRLLREHPELLRPRGAAPVGTGDGGAGGVAAER